MRLTREQAIEGHRKMWRLLAEHPGKGKQDYLIKNERHQITNNCYLCEYACAACIRAKDDPENVCNYCPLEWGGDENSCTPLYEVWHRAYLGSGNGIEVARQIAELPERKDR